MECQSPISTLKVDFGCSKDCPKDVKNMLQQLKGVESISIDPNQGKVTVVGDVNPMLLIKLLQKMGKRVQLWSFDRVPMQSRAGSHPKQKQTSHCCCESEAEVDSHEDKYHRRSKKRHGRKDPFGFGNENAPPPPPLVTGGYHPAMPGYHQLFTGYHHPPMLWYQPAAYPRPVPWYGYRHFGSRLFPMPKYNPMIHYTSCADNYR